MITALLAAGVLLADASPAAQPPARPNPDDVICRSEPEFGTRLTRKVCRSRAQMRDRQAQDRQAIDRWQDPGISSPYQAGAIWTPMRSSTLMSPAVPSQPAPAQGPRGPQ